MIDQIYEMMIQIQCSPEWDDLHEGIQNRIEKTLELIEEDRKGKSYKNELHEHPDMQRKHGIERSLFVIIDRDQAIKHSLKAVYPSPKIIGLDSLHVIVMREAFEKLNYGAPRG